MNSDKYRDLIISRNELNKSLALVHSALDRIETNESLCEHRDKAVLEILAMIDEIDDDIIFKRTQREAVQLSILREEDR